MKREWLNIKGYEGMYMINQLGEVKSIERKIYSDLRYKNGRLIKEKILKNTLGKNGYLTIGLSKDGKKKDYLIHRLISQHFIKNENNLPCINHKDGNKLNNKLDNLEWVTYLENNLHSINTLNKKPRGLGISKYGLSGLDKKEYMKNYNKIIKE